jgi:hypothetical protein
MDRLPRRKVLHLMAATAGLGIGAVAFTARARRWP